MIAVTLAIDAGTQRKSFSISISNFYWRNEIYYENSKISWRNAILLRSACEIIKIVTKDQKGKFTDILLGTLSTSLLEIMLVGKTVIRVAAHIGRTGEEKTRGCDKFLCHFIL